MELCSRFSTDFTPIDWELRIGIADDFFSDALPKNGLRHPAHGNMTGWYLWAGEALSTDEDYFRPYCARQLVDRCPEILRYLGLPSGWRFLVAPNYEDVWFDASLLEI